MTDEKLRKLLTDLRAEATYWSIPQAAAILCEKAADEIERLAALAQSDAEPDAVTRHAHRPLPRKTNVREGMSEIDRVVAETIDALFLGREVQCECGRKGFIRRHGKGIHWYRQKLEDSA